VEIPLLVFVPAEGVVGVVGVAVLSPGGFGVSFTSVPLVIVISPITRRSRLCQTAEPAAKRMLLFFVIPAQERTGDYKLYTSD
jgi:hypothetical protein